VTLAFRALPLGLLALGCTVGEGEGWVRSEHLFVQNCWNGPFDLQPDFFAANPARSGALIIRVQKGDNLEEFSDGLVVVVTNLAEARAAAGGTLEVGLPPGVSPPGVPVVFDPDPPRVSLAVYMHQSCHVQNATVYSIAGTITFSSLFSGDPNEDEADERLTEATFDATFADPRLLVGDAASDPDVQSRVTGHFRFFFQRGQPAQPFQ